MIWKIIFIASIYIPNIVGAAEVIGNSSVVRQNNVVGTAIDGMTVGLQLSEDVQIPEEINGTLTVYNINPAGSSSAFIKKISIVPYGRLGGIYKPYDEDVAELQLAPQDKRIFRIRFQLAHSPTIMEHITFRSGPAEFLVNVAYFPDGSSKAKTLDWTLAPHLVTAPVYVVAGALFGAMLLVGFFAASRFLVVVRAGDFEQIYSNFRKLCLKWSMLAAAYGVNGAIIASLLMLMSSGLGALEMPIALKLQDFSGGVAVGLFSIGLGKFVAEKLGVSNL